MEFRNPCKPRTGRNRHLGYDELDCREVVDTIRSLSQAGRHLHFVITTCPSCTTPPQISLHTSTHWGFWRARRNGGRCVYINDDGTGKGREGVGPECLDKYQYLYTRRQQNSLSLTPLPSPPLTSKQYQPKRIPSTWPCHKQPGRPSRRSATATTPPQHRM